MRCTCSTWIEKIPKGDRVYFRGESITHCPYCGLKLIVEDFKVYLTYTGNWDKNKDQAVRNALESYYPIRKEHGKHQFIEIPVSSGV